MIDATSGMYFLVWFQIVYITAYSRCVQVQITFFQHQVAVMKPALPPHAPLPLPNRAAVLFGNMMLSVQIGKKKFALRRTFLTNK